MASKLSVLIVLALLATIYFADKVNSCDGHAHHHGHAHNDEPPSFKWSKAANEKKAAPDHHGHAHDHHGHAHDHHGHASDHHGHAHDHHGHAHDHHGHAHDHHGHAHDHHGHAHENQERSAKIGNCYLKKKIITNYITNYFYTK